MGLKRIEKIITAESNANNVTVSCYAESVQKLIRMIVCLATHCYTRPQNTRGLQSAYKR